METTESIIARTGITPRTLTRWHVDGIIPKPTVRTHPSGRGKMGYYLDGTAERVERIMTLCKNGHTPKQAVVMMSMDERRGQVPDDFAVPIYKGRHDDVMDLISWILKQQNKGTKRYYVGIEWLENECVAYVDEHVALGLTKKYFDNIIAAHRAGKETTNAG